MIETATFKQGMATSGKDKIPVRADDYKKNRGSKNRGERLCGDRKA